MILPQLRKGFTLVEIMVVLAIIGVLAAALYPSLTSYLARGRDSTRVTEIKQLNSAIVLYQVANKTYHIPGTGLNNLGNEWMNYKNGTTYTKSIIDGLQEKGFIKNGIPNVPDLNSFPVVNNTAPCVTSTGSQNLYMFYFDNAIGKYSISGYMENQLQPNIDNVQLSYNGTGVTGTCTFYGRNYAVGIN